MPACIRHFPFSHARTRVDPDDEVVRRHIQDHVAVDGDGLGPAGRSPDIVRTMLVFPDNIAISGIQRQDRRWRRDHVHHAVMHQRDALHRAAGKAPGPREAELVHVLLIDLVERAVALRIVSAAEHQPVIRTGVGQHLLGHGLIVLDLRWGGLIPAPNTHNTK